jgi:SAM-dependent methyltransferase
MDPQYGAAYAELYRRHWWWRAREEFLVRTLRRELRGLSAGPVLDFGCGNGLFFDALQEFGDPFGVEPELALLDPSGSWRPRISSDFVLGAPGEQARYGLVLALDVLEHIEHPAPVVRELARRLRPGGLFVATVPAFMALWTQHDDVNHHVTRYHRSELIGLIRQCGLEVQRASYFFGALAMAKWCVARAEGLLPRRQPRVPRVPVPVINRLALAAVRLEQRLTGDRALPFGSSLLLVARAPISTDAPPSP